MDQRAAVTNTFNWDISYYVAGPMTGYADYNYPAFTEAAYELRQTGINVKCPHEIDHGETKDTRGTKDYSDYISAGLQLLLSCNGLILLRGWPESKGARLELDVALDLKYPVYYYHNWMLTDMNRRS